MSLIQIFGLLVVFALGAAASCAWAISLQTAPLLGFVLWTSFFCFCNAVTWAVWWSREQWFPHWRIWNLPLLRKHHSNAVTRN
jgi:hypothetical protein